eukprot:4924538-Prymnesium_polylepis.1
MSSPVELGNSSSSAAVSSAVSKDAEVESFRTRTCARTVSARGRVVQREPDAGYEGGPWRERGRRQRRLQRGCEWPWR